MITQFILAIIRSGLHSSSSYSSWLNLTWTISSADSCNFWLMSSNIFSIVSVSDPDFFSLPEDLLWDPSTWSLLGTFNIPAVPGSDPWLTVLAFLNLISALSWDCLLYKSKTLEVKLESLFKYNTFPSTLSSWLYINLTDSSFFIFILDEMRLSCGTVVWPKVKGFLGSFSGVLNL